MKYLNYNYNIGYPLQAARLLDNDTLLVTGGSPETGNKITAVKINFQKKKVVKRFREIILDSNDDLPTTLDVAHVSKGSLTNVILLGCNEILDAGINYENTPNHHLRKFYFEDEHLKFIASADFNKSIDSGVHTKLTRISMDTTVGATASSALPTVIKIIDPKTMEEKYEIETGRDVKDLHFSKDGKMICYITETTLEVISIVTGKFIIRKTDFNKNWLLNKVRFLNNETVLVAGTQKNDKGGIILAKINIKSKNPKIIKSKIVQNKFKGIASLDISCNSEMATFATNDSSIHIVRISNFGVLKVYKKVHQSTITSVNFTPNNLLLTSVSLDKTINVIQLPPNLASSTSFFYKLYKFITNLILLAAIVAMAYIVHYYNLHIKSYRYIYNNYLSERNISSYFQMHDNNNNHFANNIEIKRDIIDDIVSVKTLTKPVDTRSKSVDTRNFVSEEDSISLQDGFKPTFTDSDSSLNEYSLIATSITQHKKKTKPVVLTTTTTSTSFTTELSISETDTPSTSKISFQLSSEKDMTSLYNIKNLTTASEPTSPVLEFNQKTLDSKSLHKFTMNGIVYEAVAVASVTDEVKENESSTTFSSISSSSISTRSYITPSSLALSSSVISKSSIPSSQSEINLSVSSLVANQIKPESINTNNTVAIDSTSIFSKDTYTTSQNDNETVTSPVNSSTTEISTKSASTSILETTQIPTPSLPQVEIENVSNIDITTPSFENVISYLTPTEASKPTIVQSSQELNSMYSSQEPNTIQSFNQATPVQSSQELHSVYSSQESKTVQSFQQATLAQTSQELELLQSLQEASTAQVFQQETPVESSQEMMTSRVTVTQIQEVIATREVIEEIIIEVGDSLSEPNLNNTGSVSEEIDNDTIDNIIADATFDKPLSSVTTSIQVVDVNSTVLSLSETIFPITELDSSVIEATPSATIEFIPTTEVLDISMNHSVASEPMQTFVTSAIVSAAFDAESTVDFPTFVEPSISQSSIESESLTEDEHNDIMPLKTTISNIVDTIVEAANIISETTTTATTITTASSEITTTASEIIATSSEVLDTIFPETITTPSSIIDTISTGTISLNDFTDETANDPIINTDTVENQKLEAEKVTDDKPTNVIVTAQNTIATESVLSQTEHTQIVVETIQEIGHDEL